MSRSTAPRVDRGSEVQQLRAGQRGEPNKVSAIVDRDVGLDQRVSDLYPPSSDHGISSFGTGTSLTGVTVLVQRLKPGHRNL